MEAPLFGQNSVPSTTPSFGPTLLSTPTFSQNSMRCSNPAVEAFKPAVTSVFSFGQDSAPESFGATTTPSAEMFGKTATSSFGQTDQPIIPSIESLPKVF